MLDPTTLLHIGPGEPFPFGLHEARDGYNFAVFSRHATRVSLLLFADAAEQSFETIDLSSDAHRTGDVWHVRLMGDICGKSYALRVEGPWDPDRGHRYDPRILLLDPYATALAGTAGWDAEEFGSNAATSRRPFVARGLVLDQRFDWQDDRPPRHSWQDTVIYETHLRGLTIDDSADVTHRGRYLGLVEKIPYLQKLGVTAVELMPVQEFRQGEIHMRTGQPLRNYWGYNPVALFAPKASYASDDKPDAPLIEFKTMVRELHRAGIEIILDVVFNHTAEGNENGPTFSFRGLDNSIYYLLEPEKHRYIDFTGCGNTLNCNHPVVRSLVVDCLRHWVVHMHVDGFRFDLASILGRDTEGKLLANPPLLERIAEDPVLRHVKLIAEAWDLGGAFQVGHFPGQRWAQWNSDFRDDIRRFWRGDAGMTGAFATRLCGSADLFQAEHETPVNSINYITCHDGFTLNDLVSYARKHNELNGEDNRDGMTENYSENNGVEGPTSNAEIEAVRRRQIRNILATLLLSRGVPMLLGGDEFRRTQQGNNNAYCQDNAISWYDWRLAERNADLVRFVARLIALRRAHPVLSAERFYSEAEIQWLGVDGGAPQWHGHDNRVSCVIVDKEKGPDARLCLLFNAALAPARFVIPPPPAGGWRVVLDTSEEAELADRTPERMIAEEVTIPARSTMVLTASP
jgi:isoamylase